MDPELEAYEQQNPYEDFDYEGLILRRADPDDTDQIVNLVAVGKDDIYNRVYSYPRVLKLIETAYLAITVLDREGNVCAFAAFEDFPQVSAPTSHQRRVCEACMMRNIIIFGKPGSKRPSRTTNSPRRTPSGSATSSLGRAWLSATRNTRSRKCCKQSTPPCPKCSAFFSSVVSIAVSPI